MKFAVSKFQFDENRKNRSLNQLTYTQGKTGVSEYFSKHQSLFLWARVYISLIFSLEHLNTNTISTLSALRDGWTWTQIYLDTFYNAYLKYSMCF